MPRKPIDYSKTVIYKIVPNDLSMKYCYVGHTTDFKNRKRQHKSSCLNETSNDYDYKVYATIRKNGGWDQWSMIEIEKYPCNDRNEAVARERFYYELLNADLNIQTPTRTMKEYYQDNKEYLKEKQSIYYEENKNIILEKAKQYYIENKANIVEYQRKYNNDNKDKVKEFQAKYQSKYRNNNKDIIRDKLKERRFICDCGSDVRRHEKTKHFKTKKHQDFINKNIDNI